MINNGRTLEIQMTLTDRRLGRRVQGDSRWNRVDDIDIGEVECCPI